MDEDIMNLQLYPNITECLSENDLYHFKQAIEESLSNNYGNSDYHRAQMSRSTWTIVDRFFNDIEEYFESWGGENDAQ